MARFSMDMFGYILFSFRDSCPDFIPFRQNTPCVGSRRGTAQGAALLTKWGETAIIKAERALPRVVSLSVSANNYNADRLAATERSARFYGQCQGQNDHTHQKSPRKFIHSSFTPFPHGIRKGLANHFSIVTTLLSGPFDGAFLS